MSLSGVALGSAFARVGVLITPTTGSGSGAGCLPLQRRRLSFMAKFIAAYSLGSGAIGTRAFISSFIFKAFSTLDSSRRGVSTATGGSRSGLEGVTELTEINALKIDGNGFLTTGWARGSVSYGGT